MISNTLAIVVRAAIAVAVMTTAGLPAVASGDRPSSLQPVGPSIAASGTVSGGCSVSLADAKADAISLLRYLNGGSLDFAVHFDQLYGRDGPNECALAEMVGEMAALDPDDVTLFATPLPETSLSGLVAANVPPETGSPIAAFTINLWRQLCTHVSDGLQSARLSVAEANDELGHDLALADTGRFVDYCTPKLDRTAFAFSRGSSGIEVRQKSD